LCIPRIVTNALAILQLLIFYFVTKRIVEITHTHSQTITHTHTNGTLYVQRLTTTTTAKTTKAV